jgi:hypothetical protein
LKTKSSNLKINEPSNLISHIRAHFMHFTKNAKAAAAKEAEKAARMEARITFALTELYRFNE